MKKLLTLAVAIMLTATMFAGGLVTNTNQSATWVRLPARDASTSIDAAYFNPAGLMKLENGFHLSLSNQTIIQNREITNDYDLLNNDVFTGEVFAPAFPSVYAVYKMDKLAFSFGVNIIGGGGSADFASGLPSFEMSPSELVPALASQGVEEYRLDASFEGTSAFFGYQGGVSYKINDMISVFAGVRYVSAKNTYNGYLRDVEISPVGGTWMRADAFFTGAAAQVTQIKGIPTSLAPVITATGGAITLDQAVAGVPGFEEANKAAIIAGLAGIGVDEATALAMDLNTISGAVTTATPTLDATIAQYTATSTLLNDKEADVEQTATGITPIVGVNISPSENLNIGIKYEFATELEFTNVVNDDKDILLAFTPTGDAVYMFNDGSTFRGDMPAMLSLGVDYGVSEKLGVSVGTHYYFDKTADYGKKIDGVVVPNEDVIDNNFLEVAAGVEYALNEKLVVSTGFLMAKTGANEDYQSDLSYSLTSNTIGLGAGYKLNDMMMLNLGFGYTMYTAASKSMERLLPDGLTTLQAVETYNKDNMFVAVGLDFSF